MSSHSRMVPMVRSVPPCCITKSEVTRMKAAQPFMLMVVQMGRTNRATSGRAFSFISAERMVTGRVATELLVKSAISTAGHMALKTFQGFRPRARRKRGRTMKNWMRLLHRMTATYLPMLPATTPADTCAESWAEKAMMPRGSVQMSPRMSRKRSS